MKITEISKEYLEKGGLIRRRAWDSGVSIGLTASKSSFIYYKNSKLYEPVSFFSGMVHDIMADDWELNKKSTQVWQPQYDEKYYYITTSGNVAQDTFNPSFDKHRLSFKNCFKTKKEAQRMVEKIKIINKLRELSNVDFNEDFDEQKWYITYNHRTKSIECDTTYHVQRMPFCIYFKNQEDCGKAIDTIGVENLKKYYFDVEVEK